jgi:hypothetical protein
LKELTRIFVLNIFFEETADQRSSSSIHRALPFSSVQQFYSGGALFLTEDLGGDAGRSSAARSVARCFLNDTPPFQNFRILNISGYLMKIRGNILSFGTLMMSF